MTKQPVSIETAEQRLAEQNLDMVDRVVYGILRIERQLVALREWYEATRDKRKEKHRYLTQLVEAYAVPWRLRTGESTLPVDSGLVKVRKGVEVDLSDKEQVRAWVLALNAMEEATSLRGEHVAEPVPVKITVEPDWAALKDWAKWKDGQGYDPRTGEVIPGFKRGQAVPFTVSIKPRKDAMVHLDEGTPELEPMLCETCQGAGAFLMIQPGQMDQHVKCASCGGAGVIGVSEAEELGDEEARRA